MSNRPILPYYHPSTVLLVDDNQRFLENFSLQLDQNLAVLHEFSARRALSLIDEQKHSTPLDQRCFSWQQDPQGGSDHLIRLDLALVEKEISNPDRFSCLSVVVVDYDMPEMNGLDFCTRLGSHRIKKILLTGVADEKVAVQAFNEGIIDRFLMKSDPDIARRINQAIADLQYQYFNEVSRLVQGSLALKSPEFLRDAEFNHFFASLMRDQRIVEYYYVEDPDGLLLVSDTGQLKRLMVYSEPALQRALFRIKEWSPPADVIKAISAGRKLPWLWASPEEFDEQDPFEWYDFLHNGQPVQGNQTWHVALADNPPADIEFDSSTSSYHAYLDHIDRDLG